MALGGYLTGFEPTAEDVVIAMATIGRNIDLDEGARILASFDRVTLEAIAAAAINGGDDLDSQAAAAQERIATEAVNAGLVEGRPLAP